MFAVWMRFRNTPRAGAALVCVPSLTHPRNGSKIHDGRNPRGGSFYDRDVVSQVRGPTRER